MGKFTLDLESGEKVKLPVLKDPETGAGAEDERRELGEIVERMHDLFAGDITDAGCLVAVTNWRGRLAEPAGQECVESVSAAGRVQSAPS